MDTLIQAFEKGDGLIRCADQESALFELHHHHKAALTERQCFAQSERTLASAHFYLADRVADGDK